MRPRIHCPSVNLSFFRSQSSAQTDLAVPCLITNPTSASRASRTCRRAYTGFITASCPLCVQRSVIAIVVQEGLAFPRFRLDYFGQENRMVACFDDGRYPAFEIS